MANDQFHKLLRFAKRTGDRLIVTDEHGGEPLVILPFEQYEALVNGFLGPDEGEHDHLPGEHHHHEHEAEPRHERHHEHPAEPEFESEDEEIGEIEIDPVFLNPPLEVTRPVEAPRFEPRSEPKNEAAVSPNPSIPGGGLRQNPGGEEQFYLEPL